MSSTTLSTHCNAMPVDGFDVMRDSPSLTPIPAALPQRADLVRADALTWRQPRRICPSDWQNATARLRHACCNSKAYRASACHPMTMHNVAGNEKSPASLRGFFDYV
ncbi:hypothetical protein [Xanthomonas sp. GPE 39]|uniref:hypothetical protein n=1 Tax=Xanthomonas sp. GPE 39 TaxID=1583099 RepID=UPI000B13046B|nr:hypothetical protein [Xanthomonas sp. GPE 39]